MTDKRVTPNEPSPQEQNSGLLGWLPQNLYQNARQAFRRWIAKRIPAKRQLTLSHRSIFILPSAFGLAWIGLILLLYLFGTNYQNNLVIGLSLLLASLFQTCIIYSYKNLSGLTLSAMKHPQAYAGETASFSVQLSSKAGAASHSSPSANHQQICLRFAKQHHVRVQSVFEVSLAHVPFDGSKRGRLRPERITVESYFPLGLCRTWSYVDLDLEQIVFAKPKPADLKLRSTQQDLQEHQQGQQRAGIDEFNELRPFVQGESLKQVAWKQWAQGKGLLTKTFSQPQGKPLWLLLSHTSGQDLEDRLSKLAWQVDELSRRSQVFGLVLDDVHTINQNTGEAHRIACQQALALYMSPNAKAAFDQNNKASGANRGHQDAG